MQHKDYHAPLFDALQMDVERTSEKLGAPEGEQGSQEGEASAAAAAVAADKQQAQQRGAEPPSPPPK